MRPILEKEKRICMFLTMKRTKRKILLGSECGFVLFLKKNRNSRCFLKKKKYKNKQNNMGINGSFNDTLKTFFLILWKKQDNLHKNFIL